MHPLPGRWWRTYVYRMGRLSPRHRLQLFIRDTRRFVFRHVLHANDPPHRLALGGAIGVFVALTPTVGIQSLLVVFFAWLFRANKVVGLPLVWISNPATMVPIYYPCYVIGRVLLGEREIGFAWWRELSHPPTGWLAALRFYWDKMLEIALPLWAGSLVVSTVCALALYYVIYVSVCQYRARHADRCR